MKSSRKMFYAVLFSVLFTIVSVLPAFAWQFSLSDADGDLTAGENYTMTVEFEGVATDYLDLLSFAIEWDTEKLALSGFVEVPTYSRSPGFPDPDYNLFQPTFISPIPDIPNGRYYDVNGECTLGHKGEFFPEASSETLMATFTFEALETGSFTDLAGFYFTPETDLTELVNINGMTFKAEDGQLQINKIGTTSVLSAVPVPGAVWLLGSGLLGLIGLRRRK